MEDVLIEQKTIYIVYFGIVYDFFWRINKNVEALAPTRDFIKELVFFYIRGLSQACGKFLAEFRV